ncbi:MAG: 16S rRNA (cytosine(1402)-N(4))-methyltransferase RsmH [Chlamydiota bacterium]|nr:16S rRNA (cytosine(1402)-N(4))-methyltransferase RsmH [Chlamydiota bacterium]
MKEEHISVLRDEVLSIFQDIKLKTYIDGTLGAGGHASAILEQHPEIESLIGVDQDDDAIALAQEKLKNWGSQVVIHRGNFAEVIPNLFEQGIRVDGILLDLGVSSMQLDRAERGFSFMREGPLDMRMDTTASLTAAEVVNTWSQRDLERVFRDYGEEKRWRAAARAVIEARKEKSINTTKELGDVLFPVLRVRKKGKEINPLTLVFQGLRICVNRELEVIEKTLPLCIDMLRPGGRLAVITFHSLEDRIVKKIFRYSASDKAETSGFGGVFIDKEPLVVDITRKPIIATDEEIALNPRSRSAKLRGVERVCY